MALDPTGKMLRQHEKWHGEFLREAFQATYTEFRILSNHARPRIPELREIIFSGVYSHSPLDQGILWIPLKVIPTPPGLLIV